MFFSIILEADVKHDATIFNMEKKFHEQDVRKLISTATKLIETRFFDQIANENLCGISVSGQMHGIVFWNSKSIIDYRNDSEWNCSNLITWMDQRCSTVFLDTLPLFFFDY